MPVAVVAYGFSQAGLPRYAKLNIDTPVSVLDDKMLAVAHTLGRAQAALVVGDDPPRRALRRGVAARAAARTSRRVLAVLVVDRAAGSRRRTRSQRLFAVNGTSGRPLTLDQGVVFDWVDRTLGTNASVTMVPYPINFADYWASVGWWWDIEFWNKSVDRAAYLPGEFLWTPSTFPKVMLRFDPRTGRRERVADAVRRRRRTRRRASGSPGTGAAGSPDTRDSADDPRRAAVARRVGDVRPVRRRLDAAAPDGARPDLRRGRPEAPVIRTLTLGVQAPRRPRRPFTRRLEPATGRDDRDRRRRVLAVVEACVPRARASADVLLRTRAPDARSTATRRTPPPPARRARPGCT